MNREILINKIIDFLVKNNFENSNIISKQYKESEKEIEEDADGFFCYLKYNGDLRTNMREYEINNISGKYKEGDDVGFTLYIRNGILDEIRGYTYGKVEFPKTNDIKLYKNNLT